MKINKVIYNSEVYTFGNPKVFSFATFTPPIQHPNYQLIRTKQTH